MFRLSKKMIYALEAVVDIAYNGRAEPVQSKDITRRQGIPQRYLEQVMQQLVRAGVLKGLRGPRGGYFLARERRRITVGEIIDVVSALEGGSERNEYDSQSELGKKVIWPFIDEINRDITLRLHSVTIEELCDAADNRGIQIEAANSLDFNI
ncbi:MAG: Rrf2 family transcriptional regulator [Sphingomonadales bacterium]|nr:Rrf2 family transcriptional regulator [Sphingomonadales bacterium]